MRYLSPEAVPGVSLMSTGKRSSLLRESWSLFTSTETGKTGVFPVPAFPFIVVVVAPVVALVVVVVVVGVLDTRGMEGLERAAAPGRPMKVRMNWRARERVDSFWSLSFSQPDDVLVR